MTTQEVGDRRPTLVDVQAAVREFLGKAMPDVHRVDVTRVMPVEFGGGGWEAEAVVWQPNPTICALGLAVRHQVLDRSTYLVQLDGQLDVIGYESRDGERP